MGLRLVILEICKTMKEANAQHKEFEKLVSFWLIKKEK